MNDLDHGPKWTQPPRGAERYYHIFSKTTFAEHYKIHFLRGKSDQRKELQKKTEEANMLISQTQRIEKDALSLPQEGDSFG